LARRLSGFRHPGLPSDAAATASAAPQIA